MYSSWLWQLTISAYLRLKTHLGQSAGMYEPRGLDSTMVDILLEYSDSSETIATTRTR